MRRSRSKFYTDVISCEPERTEKSSVAETEFEKQRGISRVELRRGYAQVSISGINDAVDQGRLSALELMKNSGINIDFLKFTPDGLSFLVADADAGRVATELARFQVEISENRNVVLVHAVNLRDEEGLLARIVAKAIATGAAIDHLGDMHDRLLIVTSAEGADRIAKQLQQEMAGAAS